MTPDAITLVAVVTLAIVVIDGLRRRTPAPPERPRAPIAGLWPERRQRSDTLDTLFMETPEFKRRILTGFSSKDRERVPR